MTFDEKIFEVLRNFTEYGNYGRDLKKAVKVIHAYFPDKTREECHDVFTHALAAYSEAVLFVKTHVDVYALPLADRGEFAEEKRFFEKHANVSPTLMRYITGWIYHWYHER